MHYALLAPHTVIFAVQLLTVDHHQKHLMDRYHLRQQHSNLQPHIPVTLAMNLPLEVNRSCERARLMGLGQKQLPSANVRMKAQNKS